MRFITFPFLMIDCCVVFEGGNKEGKKTQNKTKENKTKKGM